MTKHSCSVREALNDWDYRTGYSMDESIEVLIAEIEDLEEQLAETDENVEAMKEGCAQRIQDAEEETEKLRSFANRWLEYTFAGITSVTPHGRHLCDMLTNEANTLGLAIPQQKQGSNELNCGLSLPE